MNKKERLIWFVGLFEGEGSFRIIEEKYARGINIPSTDLDVLNRVKLWFGGEIYKTTKRKKHWKESWVWTLSSKKAKVLVLDMIPYLLSRRKKRAEEWVNMINERDNKNTMRKDRNNKIKLMYKDGLTQQEIANIIGIERSGISRILNNNI